MIFADDIPDLTAHQHGFPGHWIRTVFMGSAVGETYEGRALLSTFVRSVEAALSYYQSGRNDAFAFTRRKDPTKVPFYEFLRASTSFENCIGHMHIAIRCMQKIRSKPVVPREIKDLFSAKPGFMHGSVQNTVRNVRDAVQHGYDKVMDGTISEGSAFTLSLSGIETPHPGQSGQTLKTWDRVEVGSHHIRFEDLARWLEEMGDCAERLAAYSPN